ncbi:4-hydroxy-2-oxo-heptane-1,7-dioate aldolase [Ensifer psoraleae]|uniref:HpcH/HpaI aldolase family protein n=1 Tax=Sinorhizobium psoraleae TaxID=520838 RepID=UPI0015696AD9|nr:aldolase/citrate lyase family protein [Sinorhizobium psoraleae]NRP72183.1 4-hydroxy-2-oxo-heptane-1,7-dioate aldolase [Sinorhizobium psoraleae]
MKPCLRTRIRNGETLLGAFVMIPSPAVVEMLGYAGFDFAIIDSEHGASSVESVENQIRAAEAAGISVIVRTVGMTAGEVLRILDAGAEGVVVPHVKCEADARALVAAAHYAPRGIRGMATTARAGRHGMTSVAEHIANAAERTLVIPQIEDAEALPNVRAIAALDGIDALFIGPADLSMSLGHPGNPAHPEVVKAIDGVVSDITSVGRRPMIFTKSAEEVSAMRRRGIDIAVYSTTSIISVAIRRTIEEVRALPAA